MAATSVNAYDACAAAVFPSMDSFLREILLSAIDIIYPPKLFSIIKYSITFALFCKDINVNFLFCYIFYLYTYISVNNFLSNNI